MSANHNDGEANPALGEIAESSIRIEMVVAGDIGSEHVGRIVRSRTRTGVFCGRVEILDVLSAEQIRTLPPTEQPTWMEVGRPIVTMKVVERRTSGQAGFLGTLTSYADDVLELEISDPD
ncbi:hypothetical protein NGF75_04065 [Dietzia kunjamensis]|uniref:hypothetical protein n=1 Tax=Dietzia kunjamensis TaxID=322509 RepID=UPI002DB806BE|nr:hypothetical protein [Dietzia kunjamensis]MEB8325163.1 hypothetical protein [Dietzia kunjamensis]